MRNTALGTMGAMLLLVGIVLLVATGSTAVALGTPGPAPVPGASDAAAMVFWRQLTFIRMFAVAAMGLGAMCFWSLRQLAPAQQRSFLTVLGGTMAALVLMALGQQTAIWGTDAGWLLVAGLGASLMLAVVAVVAEFMPRGVTGL